MWAITWSQQRHCMCALVNNKHQQQQQNTHNHMLCAHSRISNRIWWFHTRVQCHSMQDRSYQQTLAHSPFDNIYTSPAECGRCSVHNAQRTAHTRTFTCSLATMPCLSHTRYNKPRYVMFESMWLPSVSNKNYHISSQPAVCLNIQIKLKTSFCFCVFSVCFAGLVVRVAGRLRRI